VAPHVNGISPEANGVGRWAQQAGERVLCTTEVGLVCSTRTDGDREGSGAEKVQRMVLLKPKVVLESVTRALEG
jgi:hypothetical protein